MQPRTRLHVLFWTDAAALVVLVALAGTGLVMEYVLPPGSGGAGHGFRGGRELPMEAPRALLGYTRHEWGSVHYLLALVFLGLMLVHILLHLTWIKCYFVNPRASGEGDSTVGPACGGQ